MKMNTNTELMLDVGQANELKLAFRREGWNNEDIKAASERKGFLNLAREVLYGRAEIKQVIHLIDCSVNPSIPEGWTLLPPKEQIKSRVTDLQFMLDMEKLELYLDAGQKGGVVEGNKLRKKLEGVPVLRANVGDYLLKNQHLIPESWKGKAIFFWGDIYRSADGGLYVRYLYWNGDEWCWSYVSLDKYWHGSNPAAAQGK
jgi:hypothetical protein